MTDPVRHSDRQFYQLMRNRFFLALDAVFTVLIVFLAFAARFAGAEWWPAYHRLAMSYVAIAVPLKLLSFWRLRLYGRLWRYASISDVETLLAASGVGALITVGVGLVILPVTHLAERLPVSVALMDAVMTAGVITLPRLLLRVFAGRSRARAAGWQRLPRVRRRTDDDRRVLIAGAGDAGGMIAKELLQNPQLGLTPIGFVDDDATKHGHRLHGIPVLGPIEGLGSFIADSGATEVIIALPSAGGKVIREIMRRSVEAGVANRTVPGLFEIISGAKSVSALRPVQIEDLLRRDPVATDLEQVASLVTGKTVLVTGAGGSIGGELCRQLAQLNPSELVALGRGENSIFELIQELGRTYPQLPVLPVIADVRDEIRLRAVFEKTRPYSVFHAAAHKHVPLMEANIDEAILNNVLGTRNVAELSGEFDVEHLVLVSTDKAVRPTSIMGATKRIAESTLCSVAERKGKRYVSVRFGNVLGSRGSVVPTFLRQIEAGGPVTVTHPEMCRYFMTIPEAVQLVLQAAAFSKGGEVFVLDMGEPVKICDLAEDLIRLSGLEVGSDIEIAYTGMRPGEKLYEELFFGPEDATPTSHPKILQARDGHSSATTDGYVSLLIEAARRRAPESELRRMIHQLVPEYSHPSVVANGNGNGNGTGHAHAPKRQPTPTRATAPVKMHAGEAPTVERSL